MNKLIQIIKTFWSNLPKKRRTFSISLISIALVFSSTTFLFYKRQASVIPFEGVKPGGVNQKTPKYAPGEALVKFREGVQPEGVLSKVGIQPKGLDRVYSLKPVIAKAKKEYKLKKDPNGWYWFLGKKYKAVEDIPEEEIFQESYKKMIKEVERVLYKS
mgnify:FL=1